MLPEERQSLASSEAGEEGNRSIKRHGSLAIRPASGWRAASWTLSVVRKTVEILKALYKAVLWGILSSALRLANVFLAVRVVVLRCERIGHLAYDTGIFVRRLTEHALRERRCTYIAIFNLPVANEQLYKMYERDIRARVRKWLPVRIKSRLVGKLLLPLTARPTTPFFINLFEFEEPGCPYSRLEGVIYTPRFTSEENVERTRTLRNMGVENTSWYVCFHARDERYLSTQFPARDWNYHGYRNCSVQNYLKAAYYISSRGGFAIRFGQFAGEELARQNSPRIIDYARHYRSDSGDIYLIAGSRFFLGNTAGPFMVATIFNIPVVLANFIPLEYLTQCKPGDLVIPKRIWSKEQKRFLAFGEILDTGIGRFRSSAEYERAGLEPIENTAEEILAVTKEMNERLDGTFEERDEDLELQAAFLALYKPSHVNYKFKEHIRIGASFLRENRDLVLGDWRAASWKFGALR